jgi:hypothetical protein
MHPGKTMCDLLDSVFRKSRFSRDRFRKQPRPDEQLDRETQRKVLRRLAERLKKVNGRPNG